MEVCHVFGLLFNHAMNTFESDHRYCFVIFTFLKAYLTAEMSLASSYARHNSNLDNVIVFKGAKRDLEHSKYTEYLFEP